MTPESSTNPGCAPGQLDGGPGPFQTHGGSHTSVTGSPEPRTTNQSISTIELASNSPVPIVTSFWMEISMLKDHLVLRPHLCVRTFSITRNTESDRTGVGFGSGTKTVIQRLINFTESQSTLMLSKVIIGPNHIWAAAAQQSSLTVTTTTGATTQQLLKRLFRFSLLVNWDCVCMHGIKQLALSAWHCCMVKVTG